VAEKWQKILTTIPKILGIKVSENCQKSGRKVAEKWQKILTTIPKILGIKVSEKCQKSVRKS
jgi:hypothetical protein